MAENALFPPEYALNLCLNSSLPTTLLHQSEPFHSSHSILLLVRTRCGELESQILMCAYFFFVKQIVLCDSSVKYMTVNLGGITQKISAAELKCSSAEENA